MRRALPATLLALLAGLAPLAAAAEQDAKTWFRQYQRLADALRGPECRASLHPALAQAQSPLFDVAVSRDGQIGFLRGIAACAFDKEDDEAAFHAAELWVARAPDERWPQVLRMYYGVRYDRPLASLEALDVLARSSPDDVRAVNLAMLGQLRRAAAEADKAGDRSLTLYESLLRAGYQPEAPYNDDFLRMSHARLLLDRGRVDEARERLATVTDIESVVQMRVERLFEPLHGDREFARRLDLPAAVEQDLARSHATLDTNPPTLEAVYLHVHKLFIARRFAEALAVADRALARHAQDPQAYADAGEYRKWVLNTRGYVLYELGRPDEARAMLAEAAGLLEHGEPNVSNIINYAGYLVDEGRGAEAMALLPKIGDASPYGRGWIEAVRSCAGVLQADEAARTAGLDYLKSHEADNPAALSRALLCSDDVDGAAALMIRRLGAISTRGDALLALQGRIESLGDTRWFRRQLLERLARLRAREDVRAAAAAVGRIEDLPVNVGGDL